MATPIGLYGYRWSNSIKSLLILAVFPCLLVAVTALYLSVGAYFHSGMTDYVSAGYARQYDYLTLEDSVPVVSFVIERTLTYVPMLSAIATAWILIGVFFSDLMLSLSTGAKKLARTDAPDIYNALENLCISRGLRMPRLKIIDTPVTNAYASGLFAGNYTITVTRGIAEKLEKDEMEAVLAHELAHIMNGDSRLMVVTALFGNFLLFIPQTVWKLIMTASMSVQGMEEKEAASMLPVLLLLRIPLIVCVLSVGYVFSTFFRLALSRRREFMADALAVELTKNPEGLIRALEKINDDAELPYLPNGIQAMLINSPSSSFSLLDAHPTIEERIALLRRIAGLTMPKKQPTQTAKT